MTSVLRRLLPLVMALALVPRLSFAQGETVVYLVRHAEKMNPTDPDPSLSEPGKARAEALATLMAGKPLAAIVVTPRKRTAETAAPTAAASKLTPVVVSFGANAAEHMASVAKLVMEHKGKSVLVVGHSNTVPGIIAALGGPKLPDICDASYAILFTLRIPATGEPTLTRASYGVADKVEEAACQGMTAR